MNHHHSLLFPVTALAAGLIFISSAPAAKSTPVTVTNFSFETGDLTGFAGSGGQAEGVENTDGKFTGDNVGPGTLPAPADGVNAAFINAGNTGNTGTITSNSLGTVSLGQTYTLTVAVGNPQGGETQTASNFTIQLLLNGVVVTNFAPTDGEASIADGTYQDFSTSFTVSALQVGQTLTAQLNHTNILNQGNSQIFFDNVRVNVVPEPSSWAMMLGGLALLAGMQRMRRSTR